VTTPGILDRRGGAGSAIVASCSAYEDALRARDRLIAAGVPAGAVTIDGIGLHAAEKPASERALGTETFAATLGGALAGALVGFLFGLLVWVEPFEHLLALVLSGLVLGALVGAAAGILLSFAPGDGSRLAAGLRADVYAVAVESRFADRASGFL
jgi:hypothetical protein